MMTGIQLAKYCTQQTSGGHGGFIYVKHGNNGSQTDAESSMAGALTHQQTLTRNHKLAIHA